MYNHSVFGTAAKRIPDIVLQAKASSTNKKYDEYFRKFDNWCATFGFTSLPALPNTLCIFLSHLVRKKVSSAVLESYYYAINWKHCCSLLSNPCETKMVKLILEGSKRILSTPVVRKEPVTVDILKKIVDFYSKDINLKSLRVCTMCLLGFSGFLRYNEISNIRMKDLSMHDEYVEILIRCSKTDQYRQGNRIIISKTGSDLCPVSWLNRYIAAANLKLQSDHFLFSSIRFLKVQRNIKHQDERFVYA